MNSLAYGMSSGELIEAQAYVWNHTFNYINSMALKCAVELGIPDAIHNHGKPMTISNLVAILPINPSKTPCIHRLMRLLVHSGFFSRQKVLEEEGYVLANASKLLIRDNPLGLTQFVQAMIDPVFVTPWHYASTWFQNEDPTAFHTAYGRTFWDYTGDEPRFNCLFNEAMASDSRLVKTILINDCKGLFDGLESVVDIAGGTGTVAKAISEEFPHLQCTVFDLPHVVAGLKDSGNLKYIVIGGDMFDAVPPADALILKWILHDWNNEECVKILERCKEAIKGREGGKVIIIDMIRSEEDDDDAVETQQCFDVLMMILVQGQERDAKEWSKLFSDAGFSNYKITHTLGLRSVIEVYP